MAARSRSRASPSCAPPGGGAGGPFLGRLPMVAALIARAPSCHHEVMTIAAHRAHHTLHEMAPASKRSSCARYRGGDGPTSASGIRAPWGRRAGGAAPPR